MFAKRTEGINLSLIRDLLRLTKRKDIISFAGGLPNPGLFPVENISAAMKNVLSDDALLRQALQYGESAGYKPLREVIAKSYKEKDGLNVDPDLIIITNGSQQALDLVAKIFINENDSIVLESPTYLAALQAFSFYGANYLEVLLENNGPNTSKLSSLLDSNTNIKLFYAIPNFQNPTGITWSNNIRKKVADLLTQHNTKSKNTVYFIEDDPYGEIRFVGTRQKPMLHFYEHTILLGSFSKIVSPGFRIGWVIAPNKEVYNKLLLAKQAADLHTSEFSQIIIYEFYKMFNVQSHIEQVALNYKKQKDCMIQALREYFGKQVKFTNPEGGMFIWLEFPEKVNAADLLKLAIKNKVAFVPGEAFYAKNKKTNTARLNYTNVSCDKIIEGVKKLKDTFDDFCSA